MVDVDVVWFVGRVVKLADDIVYSFEDSVI